VKTKLFSRSTCQVVLTEAGSAIAISCAGAVAELDGVLQEIRRGERREVEGHLRITAPTTLTLLGHGGRRPPPRLEGSTTQQGGPRPTSTPNVACGRKRGGRRQRTCFFQRRIAMPTRKACVVAASAPLLLIGPP
jgi:hypothetical protein